MIDKLLSNNFIYSVPIRAELSIKYPTFQVIAGPNSAQCRGSPDLSCEDTFTGFGSGGVSVLRVPLHGECRKDKNCPGTTRAAVVRRGSPRAQTDDVANNLNFLGSGSRKAGAALASVLEEFQF